MPDASGGETLDGLLVRYLEHGEVEGNTPDTIKHKQKEIGIFIRHLESAGHSTRLGDVGVDQFLAHVKDMKGRDLSPETIRTRLRALRAWWNWMVRMEKTDTNPAEKIRLARVQQVPKPFLPGEGFKKLLAQCSPDTLAGSRRIAILMVLFTTGMRRRELWLLQTQDVDWGQGRINILHGKGGTTREVTLHPESRLALSAYLEIRRELDFHDPSLWVTEYGLPIGYDGLGRDMKRLSERAGVDLRDVCHIFRRTVARNAKRQNIDTQHILGNLGWKGEQMLNRYTAAMQEEEERFKAFEDFELFEDEHFSQL